MTISRGVAGVGLAAALMAGEAAAQTAGTARGVAVEGVAGWAGFVDDAPDHRRLIGASVRIPVLKRLSLGPEVVYLFGQGGDRDLFVLGSIWLDFVEMTPETRIVPYLVGGIGYMRHDENFGAFRYVSGEGSFTAGGGVRIHVNDNVYVGGDVRVGWEPHLRTTAHVGVTWPRR